MPRTFAARHERAPSTTLGQDRLTLADAAKLSGSHPVTLWRWLREGRDDPSGRRLFLPSFKVGRRRYVLREDLAAFLDAVAGVEAAPAPKPSRTARAVLQEAR